MDKILTFPPERVIHPVREPVVTADDELASYQHALRFADRHERALKRAYKSQLDRLYNVMSGAVCFLLFGVVMATVLYFQNAANSSQGLWAVTLILCGATALVLAVCVYTSARQGRDLHYKAFKDATEKHRYEE